MARILCITQGAHFRQDTHALASFRTANEPLLLWDKLAGAICSPVTVTGLFVLLLLICSASH
jgi:hypothetical protein